MFFVKSHAAPRPSFTPTELSVEDWVDGRKFPESYECATKMAAPIVKYGWSRPAGTASFFRSGHRSIASKPIVQTEMSRSSNSPLTQKRAQKVRDCRLMSGEKWEMSSPTPMLSGPSGKGNQ